MTKRLLLIDIDGVLADCKHRLPYQKAKDYDRFYSEGEMLRDKVIVQGQTFVDRLRSNIYSDRPHFVLITGRPRRTMFVTNLWCEAKFKYLDPDAVIARPDGDYRPSDVVKLERLDEYLDMLYHQEFPNECGRKYKNKKIEDKRRLWMKKMFDSDENYYVDDDPKNVDAICEAYPEIIGLVFGTERV